MRIRDATPGDWTAIWPFLHEIVAAGDTYTYDEHLTEPEARAIWMVAAPGRTTVALDAEGAVVGSASMYANRQGPGSHVASASFMVDGAQRDRGVGRALVEDALRWAADQGFRAMQFNAVTASNRSAIHLYESLGFRIVGTVPEAFRHPTEGYVGLHVMYRPL
jgi:L-amino acid N-acyltransferase YncA